MKHWMREKIQATTTFKTVFTSRGGGPKACKHSTATHWRRKSTLKMERFMLYTYREVYEASEGEYKACLKVDDEVSPGWEGG